MSRAMPAADEMSATCAVPSKVLKTIKAIDSSLEDLKEALLQLRTLLHSAITEKKNRKLLNALRSAVLSDHVHYSLLSIIKSYSRDADVLASTINCLSLLTHGSEEIREALYGYGAVKTLSTLLRPAHALYPGPRLYSKSPESPCQPTYSHIEEALLALQKLLYLHGNNTRQFVDGDGIALLIQLCDRVRRNASAHDRSAVESFRRLVEGRVLRARLTPWEGWEGGDCFKGLSPSDQAVHFASLSVIQDDTDVATAMAREGVVWQLSEVADRSSYLGPSPEIFSAPPQEVVSDSLQEVVSDSLQEVLNEESHGVSACPSGREGEEPGCWREVHVSCVQPEGGQDLGFWCQVYSSAGQGCRLAAMHTSLQQLGLPQDTVSMTTPQIGMVYAAYNAGDQSSVGAGSFRRGWFRGRVLGVRSSAAQPAVRVLAVDVGFSLVVPLNYLQALPKECRGIPNQALPCVLEGVSPVPQYLNTLRRALGVLVNLPTSVQRARAMLMATSGSVRLLTSLLEMPDYAVVRGSLAVLLNMALYRDIRQEPHLRRAIPLILECCGAFVREPSLLEPALHFLQAVLYQAPDNRVVFFQQGGAGALLQLKESSSVEMWAQVEAVLSNALGDLDVQAGESGWVVTVRGERKNPLAPNHSGGNMLLADRGKNVQLDLEREELANSSTNTSANNSANNPANISTNISTNTSINISTNTPANTSTNISTNSPANISDNKFANISANNPANTSANSPANELVKESMKSDSGNATPCSERSSSSVTTSRCYASGQILQANRLTMEFLKDAQEVALDCLVQHVCGFLNSFTGGTVYLGVAGGGAVRGMLLSRSKVDQLSTSCDRLWSRIHPVPSSSFIKVEIVPVIDGFSPRGDPAPWQERLYVVELRVSPAKFHTVYTVPQKGGTRRSACYIRRDGQTVPVKCMQELRQSLTEHLLPRPL